MAVGRRRTVALPGRLVEHFLADAERLRDVAPHLADRALLVRHPLDARALERAQLRRVLGDALALEQVELAGDRFLTALQGADLRDAGDDRRLALLARRGLTARLVGGASMFANLAPSGSMQMGDRNVIAVREVLNQLAIPIVGEEVGGNVGRSVWFTVGTGQVEVKTAGRREQIL